MPLTTSVGQFGSNLVGRNFISSWAWKIKLAYFPKYKSSHLFYSSFLSDGFTFLASNGAWLFGFGGDLQNRLFCFMSHKFPTNGSSQQELLHLMVVRRSSSGSTHRVHMQSKYHRAWKLIIKNRFEKKYFAEIYIKKILWFIPNLVTIPSNLSSSCTCFCQRRCTKWMPHLDLRHRRQSPMVSSRL